MDNVAQSFAVKRGYASTRFSTIEWLGILIGIVMPIVSAIVYPTYMHKMQNPWVEWSRLLETPFVVCEVLVILWASRKGMDSMQIWRSMPFDIKLASLFLIVGVFGSSLLLSEYPLKSVTMSLITIVHLLFALAAYHLLRSQIRADVRPFLFLLGAGLISLTLLTVLKFALPPSASTVPGGVIEWEAALPGFISVRHFGSWTGTIASGFLAMLVYRDDRQKLSSVHAFYFLATALTIWSGTRAAILAIAIVFALILLIRWKLPSIRAIGIIAMMTGAAAISAWLLIPHNQSSFMLFVPSDIGGVNQLTSGRLDLWSASLTKWSESPIWGWGSGSQFWEVNLGWPQTQPHNAIVQFLISWGLIGAIPVIWLLARAIFMTHKIVRQSISLLPILAILDTLLVMSLVEGMLHYPRFIILIMVTFAALFALGGAANGNLQVSNEPRS